MFTGLSLGALSEADVRHALPAETTFRPNPTTVQALRPTLRGVPTALQGAAADVRALEPPARLGAARRMTAATANLGARMRFHSQVGTEEPAGCSNSIPCKAGDMRTEQGNELMARLGTGSNVAYVANSLVQQKVIDTPRDGTTTSEAIPLNHARVRAHPSALELGCTDS